MHNVKERPFFAFSMGRRRQGFLKPRFPIAERPPRGQFEKLKVPPFFTNSGVCAPKSSRIADGNHLYGPSPGPQGRGRGHCDPLFSLRGKEPYLGRHLQRGEMIPRPARQRRFPLRIVSSSRRFSHIPLFLSRRQGCALSSFSFSTFSAAARRASNCSIAAARFFSSMRGAGKSETAREPAQEAAWFFSSG